MANISTWLQKIATAIYGKDVRNAIHDSINAVNNDLENSKNEIEQIDADIKNINSSYIKRQFVSSLPSVPVEFDFSDGISRFINKSRSNISVDISEKYQKITTASNAANAYAFSCFDISRYTQNYKKISIEFDTKIGGDRWYISLSKLTNRPGNSSGTSYDTSGVLFTQGTKDGLRYYINNVNTWKTTFFNKWIHSKLLIDFETKTVEYELSNKEDISDNVTGTSKFIDPNVDILSAIEVYSYVNSIEMGIDNIKIIGFSDEIDKQTGYIINENGNSVEYIYNNDEVVKLGGDHTHSNKSTLDAIGTGTGNLTLGSLRVFGSIGIGANAITSLTQDDLKRLYTYTHTHSNKDLLDNIGTGKYDVTQIIRNKTDEVKNFGINFVTITASENMPNPNHGYMVINADGVDVNVNGTSTWRLIAIDLCDGTMYTGIGSTDSSDRQVFNHAIHWTNVI